MGLRGFLKRDYAPALRGLFWSPWEYGSRWFRQQHQRDLRAVLSQIEAIVRVNAPLPEGLTQCVLDAPNARIEYLLKALSQKLLSGMNLADAMESMSTRFPAPMVAEVRAGETTGQLGDALRAIIQGINDGLVSGRELRNHTMYIGILLAAEFTVLSFLSQKVFPVFIEILSEFGMESESLSVRIMGAFSDTLSEHTLEIAAIVIALPFIALAIRLLHNHLRVVQNIWASVLMVLPVVHFVFRNGQIHHLSRALELRLRGGTPLPQALRDTASDDFAYPFQNMLDRCAREVESGTPLSTALARHRWTAGKALPELVRLGEAREDLAWAFAESARMTGQMLRRSRHVWAQAMVPIGVGIGAAGVLLVTVAAFTLFTSMGDAIIADL